MKRGFDLPAHSRAKGPFPLYSSSGLTGNNNVPAVSGPCVITGRYGTIGDVFYSDGACWPLNTTLYTTEFKGNNPKFIYYLLKTIPWSRYTTASAVPGINRNHINLCPVFVPEIRTQRAIVNILETLDEKIALNNQINGYLAAICESLAEKQQNTLVPLEGLCQQVNEKTDFSEANFDSYISTESLLPEKMGRQTASSLPKSGKVTKYQAGDTLVSNIRPYFKKVWFADCNGTCSGDVIVFRARNASMSPYLYSLIRSDSFFEYVMLGSKGTKMPRGDKKQMMTYPVAASCNQVNLQLITFCVHQLTKNARESVMLSELRDTLLPKLMSGEIDVSKVDLTQPNSHLSGC